MNNELSITFAFMVIIGCVYLIEVYLIIKSIFIKHSRQELVTKFSIVIHILAVMGLLCFLYGFLIEPFFPQVTKKIVYSNKLKKTNLRIIQLSDLHCESKLRNEKKLADIINPMKPDIIVFTGDALNEPQGVSNFTYAMKGLNANIGKYAIKGNWDTDIKKLFEDCGFKKLDNENILLKKDGEEFTISGLNFGYEGQIKGLFEKQDIQKFNIFLYHTPDLIEMVSESYTDLYLCGHTHGGQVRIPIYGAIITLSKYGKKYEMGEYKVNNTLLYVNRGLGMEGGEAPRVRFLARPEITVFDIKPKK